jgi:hypothetical protein
MQIHSVGIDLGKTTFHLVALGAAGTREEEVHTAAVADFHREHGDVADWLGSLLWSALFRSCVAQAGP